MRWRIQGPAGPAPFIDIGHVPQLAFHAWGDVVGYPSGGVRSLWLRALAFVFAGSLGNLKLNKPIVGAVRGPATLTSGQSERVRQAAKPTRCRYV